MVEASDANPWSEEANRMAGEIVDRGGRAGWLTVLYYRLDCVWRNLATIWYNALGGLILLAGRSF